MSSLARRVAADLNHIYRNDRPPYGPGWRVAIVRGPQGFRYWRRKFFSDSAAGGRDLALELARAWRNVQLEELPPSRHPGAAPRGQR